MKWQDVLPVIISILIIILVAVLQRQSRALAAILVTMPVTSPLSVWIIYSGARGERQAVAQYTQGLVVGIIPTVLSIITLWLTSRAGLKLIPMMVVSYGVWAVALAIILGVKKSAGL